MAESPRIAELRRRVEADPASSAFGPLAEEYRRAGQYYDAVTCCRAGLARHPGYLAARVTLGRSLFELGELDEAARELEAVLRVAPDTLPALRAMAEIHQRRGALQVALEYYKRALALARFDPDLEETVTKIDEQLVASKQSTMLDFDRLLASMGAPDATPPASIERLVSAEEVPAVALPEAPVDPTDDDPFGWLEHELRALDDPTQVGRDDRVLEELEAWLRALDAGRRQQSGPA